MKGARPTSLLVVSLLLAAASPATAQAPSTTDSSQLADTPIDELVARALFDRAEVLRGQGDLANAKQLYIESLERSPDGLRSSQAEEQVRALNQQLGLPPDAGLPGAEVPEKAHEETTPSYVPPHREGDDGRGTQPMDRLARIGLTGWAGGLGVVLGLAAGGPAGDTDDDGNRGMRGVAALTGLAGGAGMAGLAYWLSGRYHLDEGQSAAIASAGTWGTVDFALLGDLVTGKESDTNHVFKIMAAGGMAATGAGIVYAALARPNVGDVAFANSLSAYGLSAGLLLGVAISPPRNEAYSLQAMLGSVLGLSTGVLLADHVQLSRRRALWMDTGAAAGVAASWIVLYPILADPISNDDEQIVAGVSVLTMAGGILGALYLTRNLDEPETAGASPPATALLSRGPNGTWTAGAPVVEPAAPMSGPSGTGLALRLVDGTF